jgi:Ca-activated chloride channel family protein
MFEEPSAGFVLQARDGDDEPPVLDEVRAEGRLEGLLYTLTLRQTYTNNGPRPLEVVYTFPLPEGAVLLGLAATIGTSRLEARVLPRVEAEKEYEEALESGDAPVLLEVSPGGLHTANIGNLKPQESIELEIRFAQLATVEQGRLRIALPTTVAPRYGNPASGGLQPQQVPQVSLEAEYPLHLAVTACGALARATAECPTHPVRVSSNEQGLRIELGDGARLDRDVVLIFTPSEAELEAKGAMLSLGDDRFLDTAALDPQLELDVDTGATPKHSPAVAVAAFTLPPVEEAAERPVRLKLLVDCSGSMSGDSISSARRALLGVAQGLRADDEVSLSRFGSNTEVALPPSACSRSETLTTLREAIAATDATLGGTEMNEALERVFALGALAATRRKTPPKAEGTPRTPEAGADVLLLTDGEVWSVEPLIEAARASGHRVFAIGVGTSPAEHVLRALAEATGGACEFATPGEALESAAQRMLRRMRAPSWQSLDVRWGQPGGKPALWRLDPPAQVFPGDTALAMAGFAAGCAPEVASLYALTSATQPEPSQGQLGIEGEQGSGAPASQVRVMLAHASGTEPDHSGDDLARLAAWHRIRRLAPARDQYEASKDGTATTATQADPARLALDYQLLTDDTRCVLVHRRADADKPEEEAALHRVRSMLAAGWGGTGSVAASMHSALGVGSSMMLASVWRSARTRAAPSLDAAFMQSTPPRFSLRESPPRSSYQASAPRMRFGKNAVASPLTPLTLEQLRKRVAQALAAGQPLARIEEATQAASVSEEVLQAVEELARELGAAGIAPALAWLLLADWVGRQPSSAASSAERSAIDTALGNEGVPIGVRAHADRLFERQLDDEAVPGGLSARIRRLARAMARP